MSYEIKDRYGKTLYVANLAGANLAGANLARANLTGANLTGANLARAYLADANLAGAKGFNPLRTNDLLLLNYQVGKIRAFKLVSKDGKSPIHSNRIKYVVGKSVEVKNADTDPKNSCAAGINLATLPWVLRNANQESRVFVCEFTRKDIACIPHASDGKFRVHRCDVVAELDLEREVYAHDAKPEKEASS